MKPILFNTEMVRAILDGRKTTTRRVIKPQPKPEHQHPLGWVTDSTDNKNIGCFGWGQDEYGGVIDYANPPCRTGGVLYVRETWCKARDVPGWEEYRYDSGAAVAPDEYCFKAGSENPDPSIRWNPSIHMPREAARIFLRVTDVRADRLQEIDVDGSMAEGAWGGGQPNLPFLLLYKEHPKASCNAVSSFAHIWDSTIKPANLPLYGWDANPWVWVISFEQCEKSAGGDRS